MGLFIMVSVKCFGKKPLQVGKFIIAVLTKLLERQYKTFCKNLRTFNYHGLFALTF